MPIRNHHTWYETHGGLEKQKVEEGPLQLSWRVLVQRIGMETHGKRQTCASLAGNNK